MRPEDLTADVLMRLAGQAMVTFLHCAERFECRLAPGIWMTLSGEPVADLNYLMVNGDSPEVASTLEAWVADLDGRDLPFAAMLAPGASETMKPVCEKLGLVHAVAWPLMVCPAEAAKAYPAPGVEVARVETRVDLEQEAAVLAGAFSMPVDSVLRVTPLRLLDYPGIELVLARHEGKVLSTVTVTRHDDVVGIWAMGTHPDAQGKGIGKALLSHVMVDHKQRGASAFFLGATPAGFPLYERLGYKTVADAQVWVRGVTHQA